MFHALVLSTAVTLAQPGLPPPVPAPPPVRHLEFYAEPVLPVVPVKEPDPVLPVVPVKAPEPIAAPAAPEPKPIELEVTVPPKPKPAAPAAPAAAAAPATRYLLMEALQGTYVGWALDGNRTQVTGWIEQSFTASSTNRTNQPVVWNDRANEYLLQQAWFRIDKATVTSGTTEPTWGFRLDVLSGSDYRFSLPRGLLNSQLLNSDGTQNLYGVDPIQFYVNVNIPTVFQGLDLRAGRLYTPFGMESLEAVSTPLMSRSYAFNWCPPFTHMGIQATATLNAQWQVLAMLANGNDVFFDPAEEARFVGKVQYTSIDKRDTVALGTSIGRGKFNEGDPFAPATVGLMTEPFGRNNINVFDLVYTHIFNPQVTYSLEVIYGYQTNVPALPTPSGYGNAQWLSMCNYVFYNFSPRLSSILRFELFDDFQGQRTGFEGLYTAITAGVQYKPNASVTVRPEIRYDYNNESRPFEGEKWIVTAGADLILRW